MRKPKNHRRGSLGHLLRWTTQDRPLAPDPVYLLSQIRSDWAT